MVDVWVVFLELWIDRQNVAQSVDSIIFQRFLAISLLVLNQLLLENCIT